jgi:hypothetical protein
MSKVNTQSASQVESMEGFEGRYEELGGYTVGFETYTADDDPAPLFAGLPDDACQSPHWGFVLEGKLGYRYTDGTDETIHAGEAYYARPGHTPVLYAGTRIVEFSPTADLEATIQVVTANLAALPAT